MARHDSKSAFVLEVFPPFLSFKLFCFGRGLISGAVIANCFLGAASQFGYIFRRIQALNANREFSIVVKIRGQEEFEASWEMFHYVDFFGDFAFSWGYGPVRRMDKTMRVCVIRDEARV